jgi:hypothetical protein
MSPFYASWSFMNEFEEEKYLEMAFAVTICHLIACFFYQEDWKMSMYLFLNKTT